MKKRSAVPPGFRREEEFAVEFFHHQHLLAAADEFANLLGLCQSSNGSSIRIGCCVLAETLLK